MAQVHQQHQVFEYFGTTGRAMFTMFELTLARLGVRIGASQSVARIQNGHYTRTRTI